MKKPVSWIAGAALAITVGLLSVSGAVYAADSSEPVKSLREGAVNAPDNTSENFKDERDTGTPLPRDFVQQPPLIPHSIRGYQITANFNKCLDCHSWGRAQATGATKISVTHFRDREGHELSSVSPRRYFCVQCHVPQTDAKPLIGNTFQRAKGLN